MTGKHSALQFYARPNKRPIRTYDFVEPDNDGLLNQFKNPWMPAAQSPAMVGHS